MVNFFHELSFFSSELWLTLLLRNLVIIDSAAAREGPFLWSKTPVFGAVLGTWGLVLQAPGCIPAVWTSLSLDTSTGFGSRHCCLGHLEFSDSRRPLHSRSSVPLAEQAHGMALAPRHRCFWALEGHSSGARCIPATVLCSRLLFYPIEGGHLLFDILLLSGGVTGRPLLTSTLALQ